MPAFAELKDKASKAGNATSEKLGNTRDKYTSVSANKLDIEARQQAQAHAQQQDQKPRSWIPAQDPAKVRKPPPPPPAVPRSAKPVPSHDDANVREAYLARGQLRANPAPVVRHSSRPDVRGGPVTRVEQHEETPPKIDWVNISPEDKAMFFAWLDEFFESYLNKPRPSSTKMKASSVPAPAPRSVPAPAPARPTIPKDRATEDNLNISSTHTLPPLLAPNRPPLPGHTDSAPPFIGSKPPIPISSRPQEEEQHPEEDECLYCRDFSEVDAHAAQFPRQQVTTIASLTHDLTSPFPHPHDKARAIFIWLHHNIVYNVADFLAGTVKPSTPDATLRTGLAVCEGYAGLYADMAVKAGLECIVVGGHGKGWGYTGDPSGRIPPYNGNHAWNAIRLTDGSWHLLDSCWGAGAMESGGTYKQRLDISHFAASNEEFGRRHFPDPSESWKQFIERPLTWEEYLAPETEPPQVTSTFMEYGYAMQLLYPNTKYIPEGEYTFHLKLGCEHVLETESDAYVPIMFCRDADKDSMIHDPVNGGWNYTVTVYSGETVRIGVLQTLRDANAFGVGRAAYEAARGRAAMSWQILVDWTVE